MQALSLIELVIFTTIVTIVLVTMVSFMTATSRQARINFHRVYGTRYAEEAIEWLRTRKDDNWQNFKTTLDSFGSGTTYTYCMNTDLSLDTPLESGPQKILDSGSCGYTGIVGSGGPSIFRRTVTYRWTGDPQNNYSIDVVVSWKEANGADYSVPIRTSFRAP